MGDCIHKYSPGTLQSVGRRDGSNIFIGVVHYRTGNERKLDIAISALEVLKRYISVRGAFEGCNSNLVDCGGLCQVVSFIEGEAGSCCQGEDIEVRPGSQKPEKKSCACF